MTTFSRTNQQNNADRRGGSGTNSGGGTGRYRVEQLNITKEDIDYKDVQLMRKFINERGKMTAGRRLRMSAKMQRRISVAVKRARHLALIPIAPNHTYITNSIQSDYKSSSSQTNDDEQQVDQVDQSDTNAKDATAPTPESKAEVPQESMPEASEAENSDASPDSDTQTETSDTNRESERPESN